MMMMFDCFRITVKPAVSFRLWSSISTCDDVICDSCWRHVDHCSRAIRVREKTPTLQGLWNTSTGLCVHVTWIPHERDNCYIDPYYCHHMLELLIRLMYSKTTRSVFHAYVFMFVIVRIVCFVTFGESFRVVTNFSNNSVSEVMRGNQKTGCLVPPLLFVRQRTPSDWVTTSSFLLAVM